MLVHELVEMLQRCDPEARVYVEKIFCNDSVMPLRTVVNICDGIILRDYCSMESAFINRTLIDNPSLFKSYDGTDFNEVRKVINRR